MRCPNSLPFSTQISALAMHTVWNPCLHIVESADMQKMAEETPSDYYYDCLRRDLGERYSKADLRDKYSNLRACELTPIPEWSRMPPEI